MKNFIFVLVAVISFCFTACSTKSNKNVEDECVTVSVSDVLGCDADSASVDSVSVDSVAVDTVVTE